ncbi:MULTISPECIES: hypothetical protein [unclassified Crossiella]|uniref:hypothetical protein n=1 Tax=unclassified Crossiella TaxID=2620835 RepID=UPI001FFF211C|nr:MULTISPECIES: hypothetical protein [unclassified Crossiella]MCK2242789.1 hypothetical protein [Crossiella sp. S99.2]MCK2256666.1 hypothetical protein [Crossiella sp. S99.1]
MRRRGLADAVRAAPAALGRAPGRAPSRPPPTAAAGSRGGRSTPIGGLSRPV